MKRVIITGGSEGLGLELSKLFLIKGFEVLCISRNKPDIDVVHIKTDLTDEESIDKSIEIIKNNYKEFEFLINCAGILDIVELGKINYKKLDNLFKINVLSPIIISSSLIELIKDNEADIVNVGSTVGFKAYEKQLSYGASKWSIRGINENLQLELKKTKCRVIGFNPGGFKSEIVEKATGIKTDLSPYMEPKELAKLLIHILDIPKNMEVSEIIINRK